VTLGAGSRLLFAVDAGSNEVTAFRVWRRGLARVDRDPSGGPLPVSVDAHRDRLYVLNAGEQPNVATFRVGGGGELWRLSTRPLSAGAAGAAQVSVSPDGDSLVVTERLSNRIETFPLDRWGRPGAPAITPSSGAVPFGFAFSHRGDLVVTEASASTVSSYRLHRGSLRLVSASVATNQGAACWAVVTENGRYAYTGNASTGSISGLAIGRDGSLRLLTPDGRSADAPRPNDLALSEGSRYLYAINPGVGEITAYRVRSDGSLQALDAGAGLAVGAAGLAAR
jgi:6-phosphogluconolactonase